MEFLDKAPGKANVVSATVESLYHESQSWIINIRFWTEELSFFSGLLVEANRRRESIVLEQHVQTNFKKLEGDLANLAEEVNSHTQALSSLLGRVSRNERALIEKDHSSLLLSVNGFAQRLRSFKSELFNLMKQN